MIVHVAKMTNIAGMEGHLLALLPGLRAAGVDSRLIVLVEPHKPMDAYAAQMQALGVPTEQIIIRRDFDPALIGTLACRFREIGCDAVHTHLIHADLHATIAAKRAGVRFLYCTAHNDDGFRHYLPVRLLQAWLWRQVRSGIAISKSLRQFLIKVEFAPAQRIHTVHYGLDASPVDVGIRESLRHELGLSPDTLLAGSVCRLITQKGLIYALEAFAHLTDRFPDVHYAIVGDGVLRSQLESAAQNLNIAGRVHFLGWRNNARALMGAFDIFLIPSLWEGFGLVALEAMAAHLPVIASRVSALPEIITDGETGCLVPPADSEALAVALVNLIDNPSLRVQMGENGNQRLEQTFSVKKMVESTLAVYDQHR